MFMPYGVKFGYASGAGPHSTVLRYEVVPESDCWIVASVEFLQCTSRGDGRQGKLMHPFTWIYHSITSCYERWSIYATALHPSRMDVAFELQLGLSWIPNILKVKLGIIARR
ncbi:hypothetical protein R1flu_026596 [Riccia fluitans]|uniref:Uncharacterized protein n=1 Tax=Riccia fluitans TaxID=41844 RepID=A0ABD1XKG0_9MARC